jgi:hypothetical protein
MTRRIVLEVELLDADGTWTADEMATLAERVEKLLRWHSIAQDSFCELGEVTAKA